MRVLAVGSQKGGVGKTTTAGALAVLLSRQGQQVHVIDMDPQASLTSAFGRQDPEGLLYQALSERQALPVIPLVDKLTFTPSTIDLARGESQFIAEPAREFILRSCLDKTPLSEDTLVIVDCPPSLGVLAINCLTAAHDILITVQPGGFELRALVHFQRTVDLLKERVNNTLSVAGAVLTNCKARRRITELVREEVGRHYRVLGQIREDASLLYATTEGRLHELEESRALEDYQAVAQHLVPHPQEGRPV